MAWVRADHFSLGWIQLREEAAGPRKNPGYLAVWAIRKWLQSGRLWRSQAEMESLMAEVSVGTQGTTTHLEELRVRLETA